MQEFYRKTHKKWRFYDSKTFNIIAINNCFAVNYKENDIKPLFLIIKKLQPSQE